MDYAIGVKFARKRPECLKFFCLLSCLCGFFPVTAPAQDDAIPAFQPYALPSTRSTLVIFNRFMSLPPFTARVPEAGAWVLAPSLELSQVLINGLFSQGDNVELRSFFDYEVLALELPVTLGLGAGWCLGVDLQLDWFSGGFLDAPIRTFHTWFGFPNNSRGTIPDNRVSIAFEGLNGISFHKDAPVLALADPVFFLGWGAIRQADFKLAFLSQLAVPLGLGAGLVGATGPQLGLMLSIDWWPAAWLGLHGQAGGILPLESRESGANPVPIVQVHLSVVGNFDFRFLPYIDIRLATSPARSLADYQGWDFFSLPNADLRIGLLLSLPGDRTDGGHLGISLQEDPFSHNSADVGFQASAAFALGP